MISVTDSHFVLKSETPSNNNLIADISVSRFPVKGLLWLRLDGPSTCINPFSYLSCYWTKCYTIMWLILLGRALWVAQGQALVLLFCYSCHVLLYFRIFGASIGTRLKFYHTCIIKLLFRQRQSMDETSAFLKPAIFVVSLLYNSYPVYGWASRVHTASLYFLHLWIHCSGSRIITCSQMLAWFLASLVSWQEK